MPKKLLVVQKDIRHLCCCDQKRQISQCCISWNTKIVSLLSSFMTIDSVVHGGQLPVVWLPVPRSDDTERIDLHCRQSFGRSHEAPHRNVKFPAAKSQYPFLCQNGVDFCRDQACPPHLLRPSVGRQKHPQMDFSVQSRQNSGGRQTKGSKRQIWTLPKEHQASWRSHCYWQASHCVRTLCQIWDFNRICAQNCEEGPQAKEEMLNICACSAHRNP